MILLRKMIDLVLGSSGGPGVSHGMVRPGAAKGMRVRMGTPAVQGRIVTKDGHAFAVVSPSATGLKTIKIVKPGQFKELRVEKYVVADPALAGRFKNAQRAKSLRQNFVRAKEQAKHGEHKKDVERAKRIAKLKAQIAKVQREMKALKRELAK